jgi:hypothetical protein
MVAEARVEVAQGREEQMVACLVVEVHSEGTVEGHPKTHLHTRSRWK